MSRCRPHGAGRYDPWANIQPPTGAPAHETFIHHAAHGTLAAYAFDVWNLHQCAACGSPGDLNCHDGHLRFSINMIAYSRARMAPLCVFGPEHDDEPFISEHWPSLMAPHRAGVAGDALIVHFMVRNGVVSPP